MPAAVRHALLALLFACSLAKASPENGSDKPPDFWQAAAQGDIATLQARLDAGQAVDQVDAKGDSALIHALRQKQFAASELLLTRGANPSQNSGNQFSALGFAFWAGIDRKKPEIYDGRWLRLLLDRHAEINAATAHLDPLLYQVATAYPPQPEALKLVLTYHPRIDQRSGRECDSALGAVIAMESRFRDAKNGIVRQLLAAGADPNLVSFGSRSRHAPTPLLKAVRGYGNEDVRSDGVKNNRAARLALIDLLFEFGADPRAGADPALQPPAECADAARDGGSSIDDLAFDVQGNPALTTSLGDTAAFRDAFERVLRGAAPVAPGEIGYAAIEHTLARYARLAESLEMLESYRYSDNPNAQEITNLQARRADLEHALQRLLELGARINPDHVILPPEGRNDDLPIARSQPELSGIEYLPLYEYRLPDDLYLRVLQAGADPAIRPGDFSGNKESLLSWLIRHQAASKLDLLKNHLGPLKSTPRWCGRSVLDIWQGFGYHAPAWRKMLATPAGAVAREILIELLNEPNCSFGDTVTGPVIAAQLRELGDPELNRVVARSPLLLTTPATQSRQQAKKRR